MSARDSCEIRPATVTITDRQVLLNRLQAIGRTHQIHIICFDADKMAGRRHVLAALRHALRSREAGSMISNSFEMEALLFAAGSRQCSIASSFGFHEGENRLWVCCCPESPQVWQDLFGVLQFVADDWTSRTPEQVAKLRELFGITDEELEAAGADRLDDLILERTSLLEVNR